MSVKNRIKEFAKYHNMSIADFEREINVANGYVNSISKSVGIDKLELIIEKFPSINIEWLLTGTGEMHKVVLAGPVDLTDEEKSQKELAEARKLIIDLLIAEIDRLKAEIFRLKSQSEDIGSSRLVAEDRPPIKRKK